MILTVTLNPCIDKTITVSDFSEGGLNRVKNTICETGGKGLNVSKVLKSFKTDTFATGITYGDFVQKELDRLEIKNDFAVLDGTLRTNIKIFDEKAKVTTELNEKGILSDNQILKIWLEKFEALLTKTDILVLSGSIPTNVDTKIYANLITLTKQKNIRTILDTDGDSLQYGIDAVPFAVKPNIFELEQYTNQKLDTDEKIVLAMQELIKKGISYVIVSMGKDGSICMNKDGFIKNTPIKIDVKSTVGAGDSMVAAIAYSIYNGYGLKRLSCLSNLVGCITASKDGTSLCTLEDILRYDKSIL